MNHLDKPAMPQYGWSEIAEKYTVTGGMTIRQHAAITLRVPMSGDPELDAMIREARRLDVATAAMQAIVTGVGDNDYSEAIASTSAFSQADALLAASEPKKAEPISMSELQSRINDRIAASDPQPDAEGWIEWPGGKCPVPAPTKVQIKLRDGSTYANEASYWLWGHGCFDSDIIAYRVVK